MNEEKAKQKCIKISHSDFSKISHGRSTDSYFRSLESYLRKNNNTYNIDDQVCVIYVNDKNDAMRIGLHFGLHRIEYFDGLKSLPLVLFEKKKRGRPKAMIFDNDSGKAISIKNIRKQSLEEVTANCLEKKEIIKRKILTKSKLENAINKKELVLINVGSKSYINRYELATFIKNHM
ncbi:MAG: hypothetical protein NTZ44_01970 [Candidatus Nomurabacteria bacterium]|nr:hypothetical protein [Candidatus Nomurabacteria bacterium]